MRQGCPLSPYLFIVGAEILACKIRQDKTIKGITVFQKELKLSQFADDTTLLCNDCNSVNQAITVLNSFGNLSGLRLNPSKTKTLCNWLGSLRNRKDEPFNFKWPKEPLRVMRNKTRNSILKARCKNLTPFLAYGTLGTSIFLVSVL